MSWMIAFIFWQQTIILQAKNLQELISNLNPYGAVILTDNLRKINREQTDFLRSLMNHNPAIVIDLNIVNDRNDDRSTRMPVSQSTIYIILPSRESEISNILDNIVKISPVSSRPKTLLLLPTKFSEDELKKIFNEAWSLKFLDFTVIIPDVGRNHYLMTYNPFTNDYITNDLRNVDELFLDKLENVHGYPMKTRAFHIPPLLTTEIKNNKIIKVSGSSYSRIEYVAKKLNFNLTFMEDSHNVTVSIDKMVTNLEWNEINMSPTGFFLKKNFKREIFW